MKYFSVLTGKVSDRVTPVVKSEVEFWKVYLTLLNARSDNWITRKEIKVLSWILSQDKVECYFSKPGSLEITEQIENLSFPELSRIKKKLVNLKLVKEDFVDGRIKTLPHQSLQAIQRFVKKEGALNCVFPIEINETA